MVYNTQNYKMINTSSPKTKYLVILSFSFDLNSNNCFPAKQIRNKTKYKEGLEVSLTLSLAMKCIANYIIECN